MDDLTGLDWYVAASSHDLLTADAERALGRRAQGGDLGARNDLVAANLRLAMHVAGRYAGRGLPLEDLVQHANIGLLRAADKFDPDKGFKFSTYATWWCQQACQRAIDEGRHMIRLPVHMAERTRRLWRAIADLYERDGQAPDDAALAAHLGWSAAGVANVRRALRVGLTCSLDEPLLSDEAFGDERSSLAGYVAAEVDVAAEVAARDARTRIRALLARLEPRARQIVALRYGLDGEAQTLEQIGQALGITRERVRQLERDALARLRELAEAQGLREAA